MSDLASPLRQQIRRSDPGPKPALWSTTHAALLDGLFGDGHVLPGGAEEVSRLARPIGLSAEHVVLLVGAGTGGPVLSLAEAYDARVDGFEVAGPFADVATARIRRAGLGGRVSLSRWSRGSPAFRPAAFDHAVALAPLGGAEPDAVLAAIAAALRPGGHLVLLDLVCGPAMPADQALLQSWLAAEGRAGGPPDELSVTASLARQGFGVRVAQDITQRHLRLAMVGWQRLLRSFDRRPTGAMAAVLLAEAERWLSVSELLQSGTLRLLSWHAVLEGTRELDVGSLRLEIMLAVQFRNWRSARTLWETLSQTDVSAAEAHNMRRFISAAIQRDKRDLPEEIRTF